MLPFLSRHLCWDSFMKFQKLINFGVVVLLAISYGSTHAQEEVSVTVGETVKIPVPIKTDKICSLEITVGSEKIGRIAQAPAFVAEFDYKGIETGIVIAKWEGVIRFRGLNTTTACPGSGSIKIRTLPNTEQLKKEWERIFSSL